MTKKFQKFMPRGNKPRRPGVREGKEDNVLLIDTKHETENTMTRALAILLSVLALAGCESGSLYASTSDAAYSHPQY